jgi:hypothetical protein
MSANMKISEKMKNLNNLFGLRLKENEIKENKNAPEYNPKHLEQTSNCIPLIVKHL